MGRGEVWWYFLKIPIRIIHPERNFNGGYVYHLGGLIRIDKKSMAHLWAKLEVIKHNQVTIKLQNSMVLKCEFLECMWGFEASNYPGPNFNPLMLDSVCTLDKTYT